MNFSFDRKQIVTVLFALAFLLLLLNAIIPRLFKSSEKKTESIEINSDVINRKFLSAVQGFGIKDEWVKVPKPNKNYGDSLKYYYTVNVPPDLPIALILNDIKNSFGKGEVDYSSKEIRSKDTRLKEAKSKGTTTLILKSGGFEKLKAEFVYNPAIKRTSNTVGFLVFGFNSLDTIRQYELINSPENFLAVLIPSKDALGKIKRLKTRDKDYAVMLTGDISDLDYKLSTSYSLDRLKISIRSVLGDFPKAAAFLYDGKSSFASSSMFQLIKKEFEIRRIKFLDINRFDLIDESGTPLDITFESILNQEEENKTELIFISEENYYKLRPEILKFRKTGYKFINPYTTVTSLPR
jgi:hypothetical protein